MRRFFHKKHSKNPYLSAKLYNFPPVIQLDVVVYDSRFTPLFNYHSNDSANKNDE